MEEENVSNLFILKDWIFDSVIAYIKSPNWKIPIMQFIDDFCLGFDSEEENKLEYTQIHGVKY
jgi:hypothetical protein